MKSLNLLIALPARPDQVLAVARQTAPSLIKLFDRGETIAHEPGLSAALCQAFGIERQQDWPLAPISAAAEGLQDSAKGYWLRLDPVNLEVVMGGLLLRPPASLQLAMEEADALISDINLHWQDTGLALQAASPTRWHLRLPEPANLRTTPLDQMAGEYLTPHLPRGADARLFMQRINELQMLLHSHTVNLIRDDDARPVVNGLWLWGGGTLTSTTAPFDLIAADDFLTRALAQHSGVAPIATAKTLAELSPCNHALVVLGQAEEDFSADLAEQVMKMEQNWFQPLLSQMAWGRIKQLRLQLIGQHAAMLTPLKSWRIWR